MLRKISCLQANGDSLHSPAESYSWARLYWCCHTAVLHICITAVLIFQFIQLISARSILTVKYPPLELILNCVILLMFPTIGFPLHIFHIFSLGVITHFQRDNNHRWSTGHEQKAHKLSKIIYKCQILWWVYCNFIWLKSNALPFCKLKPIRTQHFYDHGDPANGFSFF